MKCEIVYIEDDQADFLALKRLLKPISNEIDLIWINSQNSLNEFKERQNLPSIIILDYHFPGSDAIDIIQYFRGISINLEIVMLTSFQENKYLDVIKRLGVKYIFNKNNLEDVFEFILEKKEIINNYSESTDSVDSNLEKEVNNLRRIVSGALQTFPDPIIFLDPQLNIIYKNLAYDKLAKTEFPGNTENFLELIQVNRSGIQEKINATNLDHSQNLLIQIEGKYDNNLSIEIVCSFIPKDTGYYCLHLKNYTILERTNRNSEQTFSFNKLIPKYISNELAINANAQILINQNFEIIEFNNHASNLYFNNLKIGESILSYNNDKNAHLISQKIQNAENNFISFPVSINNLVFELYANLILSNSNYRIYALSFIPINSEAKFDKLYFDPIKNSQLLIENSESIIFQLDKNGNYIYLSESFESITGFSIQGTLNKPIGIPQDPEVQEHFKIEFNKLKVSEIKEATGYSAIKTQDNETKHLRYRMESIIDIHGNFIGISGVYTDVTDTFRISKTLKKTEEYLNQIINNVNELIFVVDNKTRITFSTPSSLKITGYTIEELQEQRFIDFIHPQDYKNLIKFLKTGISKTILQEKKDIITIRFKKKNGEYTYLETFIKKVETSSNKKIKYIGTSRSVDEKIAADLKLKEAKKYLEISTQIQKIYIETKDISKTFGILLNSILVDTKSDFGFICEVFFDEKGIPFMRSNALTNIAWDQASKEFYEKHAKKGVEFRNLNTLFGRVLLEKKLFISNDAINDPYSGGTPPGHPIIKTFVGIPIFKNEEMVSVLGLANNLDGYSIELVTKIEPLLGNIGSIIEQNKIELEIESTQIELAKSEAQIKAILTSIEDIVFEINEELVITNVWAKDPEKLIIPKPQYFNQKFEVLVDKFPFLLAIYNILLEVVEDGIERDFEYSLYKSNIKIWNKARIFVLTHEPKKFYCLQISDITDTKMAEENLKQNLIHANELSELKSRFVTLTSHEFRTPLTSISSSNELIAMGLKKLNIPISEKLNKYIQIIQSEVSHMTDLLNDLLVLGKIDANKTVVKWEVIDLKETILEIIDNLFITSKIPCKVKLALKGQAFKISLDIKLLEHILINLLNNAFKYSPGRPDPIIEISFLGNLVALAVQDFGIGIPKLDQPKLFEQFFRASNVGKINGVGLGLVIVKNMVELLKGDIRIESEEGKGTRIEISLNKSNLE